MKIGCTFALHWLARTRHADGGFVVHQGDDERFDYFYKFTSEGRVDPNSRPSIVVITKKGGGKIAV
jgi:secreted PhoX family phosphatase